MITYEVNLEVAAALRAEYLAWLQAHVAEILRLDGFEAAMIEEDNDPAPPTGHFALCVRYRVRDATHLQAYFDQHAACMRAEGIARFGEGFRAHRRVLQPL